MRSARGDERGAIMPAALLMTTFAMLLAGFAIDVSADRVVARDMQALSDIVALDLARELDGRTTASYSTAALDSAKSASVNRNDEKLAGGAADVTYELGVADDNGAWLRVAAATDRPNAVRVTSLGTSSIHLRPGAATVRPERKAIAVLTPPQACFTVGSSLASVDTASGRGRLATTLNNALPINADVFSSDGILTMSNASVPLVDLATALNAGTPNELMDTTVDFGELLAATATVLSNHGDSATLAAVNTVLANWQAGHPGGGTRFLLGELIDLTMYDGALMASRINVLDLISGWVYVMNGTNVIHVPNANVDLGLTNVDVKLKVIDRPHIVCGPAGTVAQNNQVQLDLTATLSMKRCTLNLLGICLVGLLPPINVPVTITLQAVEASGTLQAPTCEPLNADVVVSSSAAKFWLKLGDATLANGSLISGPAQMLTFTSAPSSQHVSGVGSLASIGLGDHANLASTLVSLIDLVIGSPLVDVLTEIINDSLEAAGVSVNGTSVTLSEAPLCNIPALRK